MNQLTEDEILTVLKEAIEEIKAIASTLPTDQAREAVVLFLFSIGFTAEQTQQIINNDTVLKNIFTN